ncbi:MAG: hypothetical protein CVT93_09255 [Bacteroidetes bacterium HGW-Bacteroidetes-10]|nr:MAG: hypothetical protein CVT93_09255 [Bacteroidetes bacterium HGW-Bacteroidetes-10]
MKEAGFQICLVNQKYFLNCLIFSTEHNFLIFLRFKYEMSLHYGLIWGENAKNQPCNFFFSFFLHIFYQIVKKWNKILSTLLFGGFFHKLFYWRDCRSVATKEK